VLVELAAANEDIVLVAAICISCLNVKPVRSNAGLSDFGDSSMHQSVDAASLMRSLPNMIVISPCDAADSLRKPWSAQFNQC
jgi:transketolase